MAPPYHPPAKYSVRIAGHRTSISLEPLFWSRLGEAAAADGVSINALVARIDAERIQADPAPGLASALRIWVLERERGGGHEPAAPGSAQPGDQ